MTGILRRMTLHHDLAGERPDRGAREARRDQREREERARRAAEDRLQRLVRALERVDVLEPFLKNVERGHHEHRDVDQCLRSTSRSRRRRACSAAASVILFRFSGTRRSCVSAECR